MSKQSARSGRERRGEEPRGGKTAKSDSKAKEARGERARSHVPERSRAASPEGDGRPARVAARVRAELSELMLRGEIRDPSAQTAMVSSVEVTRDLSLVKVGLRALDLEMPVAQRERMVLAFQRAAGFLRARIGQSLGLRQSPELRFAWDAGVDHAARVEALLRGDDDAPEGEGS